MHPAFALRISQTFHSTAVEWLIGLLVPAPVSNRGARGIRKQFRFHDDSVRLSCCWLSSSRLPVYAEASSHFARLPGTLQWRRSPKADRTSTSFPEDPRPKQQQQRCGHGQSTSSNPSPYH